mmetsp:Transcript_59090/g.149957  ORF Transcript_59090/g.149957 Transcript_59090/m.149957 type:complete len:216 (+) Transcript_59090:1797-2444(+)
MGMVMGVGPCGDLASESAAGMTRSWPSGRAERGSCTKGETCQPSSTSDATEAWLIEGASGSTLAGLFASPAPASEGFKRKRSSKHSCSLNWRCAISWRLFRSACHPMAVSSASLHCAPFWSQPSISTSIVAGAKAVRGGACGDESWWYRSRFGSVTILAQDIRGGISWGASPSRRLGRRGPPCGGEPPVSGLTRPTGGGALPALRTMSATRRTER